MTARHKLNSAAIHGALIVAGLTGWLFSSWWAFLITAAVLIASAFHAGDIRYKPTRPDRK